MLSEQQREDLRDKRFAEIREELEGWDGETGNWFWLSFAGDEGFRGAAIVRSPSPLAAFAVAHSRSLNPGGEVATVHIPDEMARRIPERWRWRLLSRQEAAEFDKEMLG